MKLDFPTAQFRVLLLVEMTGIGEGGFVEVVWGKALKSLFKNGKCTFFDNIIETPIFIG